MSRLGLVEFVQTKTVAAVRVTASLYLVQVVVRAWTVTQLYSIAADFARLAAFSPSLRARFLQRLWTRSMLELGENYWLQVTVVGGMLLLAAALATVAVGLFRSKKWARRPAMVLACVWFAAGVTFKRFFGINHFSFIMEVVFQGLLCGWTLWLLRRVEVKREFGIT